ncbi:hypothetical protein FVE85_2951 [Porphyridium purpureum]|uniref:Uncharacterized protein n=1 Tax=Porphyridium purpureum TaxID=35688 RepID=A0A5J4YUT3_PORPP|nr:hypothetical protein FVE85_2951 [Porphyridium purpureum]|eukprot:POR4600..scf227_4
MDNMRLERYSASTEAAKSDVLRLHMAEVDALLYALEQAYARRAPFIAQQSMLEAAVGAYTLLFVRTHAPLVGATALTTSLAHRRRRLLAVFQRAAVRDFLANVAVLGWLKRSRPARILFTVTNRLQVLHSKRFLINMLRFRLLRLFTGCITTRARMYFGQSQEGKGWSESVAEQSGPVLPSHSVKIKFDAPRISLGRAFSISYGRASEVDMRVTYLDDRLRLMRGPHEELYVFVRVRPGSDLFRLAQEWRAHLAAPTMHPRVALVGALLFAIGCFCVTWTFADMQVALLLTAIFALVSLSLRKEGMSL